MIGVVGSAPGDINSQPATQAGKELAAKRKPDNPDRNGQAVSAKVPPICVEKPATTGTNPPATPYPAIVSPPLTLRICPVT